MERTIFLAIIAASLFALAVVASFWFFAAETSATMPHSVSGYTVEALAVNLTILQMVMGLIGVFLTVLGLFGWTSIKAIAVEAAEKEARKTVSDQLLKLRTVDSAAVTGMGENSGLYGGEQETTGATPASEGE